MKDSHLELLPAIPGDLAAVSLTTGAWVGVGGAPRARELFFGSHRVRTSIACEFPLICALDARQTPETVHGAAAVSADGATVFFHRTYTDKTGVYAWQRGERTASRVGAFPAPLEGLPGGWFLGRVGGIVARVRFPK